MAVSPSDLPPVVTRFAPSPTGHLHVGGARTALFCWAFARKMGGHFALRIEDTDAARSSVESARGIMEDLAWLGIDWDEGPELRVGDRTIGGDPRRVGPFFQAQRVASHYNPHIMMLVEQGKAYPAFETPEQLEAQRKAALAAKQTYRYDRASYTKVPDVRERIRLMERGEPHVVRFLAPASPIVVHDQVLGDVKIAAGELDDFVIRKADGFPTYHFAVVVDDQTMGVTHVLRAQEHLINTPRHVALQQAFGFRTPVYGHMPLIFNMDGTKMSKRDKAKAARKAFKDALAKDPSLQDRAPALLAVEPAALAAFLAADNDSLDVAERIAAHLGLALPEIEVADFREAGYTPGAILNFLALLGWNPGMKLPDGKDLEKFDLAFLRQHFSIERIGKTNAKFDRAKLLSFNADAIGAMDDASFARAWHAWCTAHAPDFLQRLRTTAPMASEPERFALLARAVRPRAKTFRDACRASAFALLPIDQPIAFDAQAADKHLRAADATGLRLLAAFRPALAALATFDPAPIHAALEQFVREQALPNPGPIAQAVRVALTGSAVTPGLDLTMAILGRETVLRRIDDCLRRFT